MAYKKKRPYSKFKSGYGRYSKSKFKSGYKRPGSLYRTLGKFKKSKHRGIRYAQRRYQITRYRVNNLIAPDELIMKFKWNRLNTITNGTPNNFIFPIFGIEASQLSGIHNWAQQAANYRQVEILSGSLVLYIFNNMVNTTQPPDSNLITNSGCTALTAHKTFRIWEDQDGVEQQENIMPDILTKVSGWETLGEMPGVSMRFITSGSGQKNVQRYKFKYTQKSFKKGLKADPTKFQADIATLGTTDPFPKNRGLVKFGVDISDANVFGRFNIFQSNTHLVKFKGRLAN